MSRNKVLSAFCVDNPNKIPPSLLGISVSGVSGVSR